VIWVKLRPFSSGRIEEGREAIFPGFPVGFRGVFEVFQPPASEGDVLDFIFKDPIHELAGKEVAVFCKDGPVKRGKVEVGHFEGQAQRADIAEGSG
jgi:hypothetical protein